MFRFVSFRFDWAVFGSIAVPYFRKFIAGLPLDEEWLNSHVDDSSVDDRLDDIELRLRMLISGGIAEEKGAAFEAINTVNFRRTVEVGFAGNAGGSLKHSPPVVFGVSDSGHTDWVVDLPPMGMAQLAEKGLDTKNHFRRDPPVHSNNLLRNEFLS